MVTKMNNKSIGSSFDNFLNGEGIIMENKNTVLIVDDVEMNVKIIEEILKDDYQVLSASDGKKALEILGNVAQLPKLILLDTYMPEMTGMEMFEAMKTDEKLKRIPVIFISAEVDFESKLLAAGAVDFIMKPFLPEILKIRVQNQIERFTSDIVVNTSNTDTIDNNDPIIFLSHSSSDKSYGDALKFFISELGVKRELLIYTSHPMHKIPFDANIYDYLRSNFHRKIFVIFLLSNNFLESPACLNEMGAAWVTQSDFSNVFTPNFDFNNPKFNQCAVDIRKMGLVLNGDANCKTSMIELKNKIMSLFGLPSMDEIQSSHLLDEFIKKIKSIE